MQVECTHHVDAGEPDADGMYENHYEYDIYRFVDGDLAIVVRSYVDRPHEAHFLRVERAGHVANLRRVDMDTPLVASAKQYLAQHGKTELRWLDGEGAGYTPLPDAMR